MWDEWRPCGCARRAGIPGHGGNTSATLGNSKSSDTVETRGAELTDPGGKHPKIELLFELRVDGELQNSGSAQSDYYFSNSNCVLDIRLRNKESLDPTLWSGAHVPRTQAGAELFFYVAGIVMATPAYETPGKYKGILDEVKNKIVEIEQEVEKDG